MSKTKEKIEKGYRIPCGSLDVSADRVCRKSLSSGMEKLLDRLTQDTNPVLPGYKLPKGVAENGSLLIEIPGESREEKKARLVREGILRAEVRDLVKQYQENLQGNSKLLQDITGKINTHYNSTP